MKKIFAIICCLALSAALLAACGKEEAKPAAETTVAETAETATEKASDETTTEAETTTAAETTAAETTTAAKETIMQEETEKNELATIGYPEFPEEEGWYVCDGLAVRIKGYYFSESAPEIMVDGVIQVVDENDELVPSKLLEIHVMQEGYELNKELGANLDELVTAEFPLQLEEIYHTESTADITVEVVFKSGQKRTWTKEDF